MIVFSYMCCVLGFVLCVLCVLCVLGLIGSPHFTVRVSVAIIDGYLIWSPRIIVQNGYLVQM